MEEEEKGVREEKGGKRKKEEKKGEREGKKRVEKGKKRRILWISSDSERNIEWRKTNKNI